MSDTGTREEYEQLHDAADIDLDGELETTRWTNPPRPVEVS